MSPPVSYYSGPLQGLAAPITNQREKLHKPAFSAMRSFARAALEAFLYNPTEGPEDELASLYP